MYLARLASLILIPIILGCSKKQAIRFEEISKEPIKQIQAELLGVIGSFNYKVIRVTEMPSILIEQAFMSHAEDEEKLACNRFRQDMAEKIYQGIIDFLKYMSSDYE